MVKIRSSKITVYVDFDFSPIIFEWHNVPGRFFEMIESALVPILGISNPNNFAVQPSDFIGEVAARYNIFGGSNSVSLLANKLTAEFPNVSPGDTELIIKILGAVYSGFCEKFSERQCSVVRVRLYEHANIIDGSKSMDYLSRYSIPIENSELDELDLEIQPTGRFLVNSNVGGWSAVCMVEISDILKNTLFLEFEPTFNIENDDTFDTILERFNCSFNNCLSILNLQHVDEE